MIGVSLRLEKYVQSGSNFIFFYICIYLYTHKKERVMTHTKLTTVKIVKDVYSKFKQLSFDSNITLQKLVNRSINKYIEDETFRSEINEYSELHTSGSQF